LKQVGETVHVGEPAFYHVPIKAWPEDDRPREKLLKRGPESLTECDLLAILIRTGKKGITAVDLARRLFGDKKTLRDIASMKVEEIQSLGIGESRAIAIVAAFELAKRLPEIKGKERFAVRSPEDVVQYCETKLRDLVQEELWVFPLNAMNQILEPKQISKGILNSSLAHPRECFREAISQSAAAVIFAHNHPSGNPEPSQEDLTITKQLVEAGRIIGIEVHDHIIIAGDTFTSFAERRLIS
jgi:DNA repair protein RadC